MEIDLKDNFIQEIGTDTSVQYLTFLIDGQRYGMTSANVIEIVKIPVSGQNFWRKFSRYLAKKRLLDVA